MDKFREKIGLTLTELLLSTLLISIIFLAVGALYNASQRFYLSARDRVILGYELQYAIQHIYKNVMTGIGDKNNPAIEISLGNLEFSVRHIDKVDPADSPTYNDYTDDTQLGYKIETDGTLLFDGDGDGTFEDSLVPQVTILLTDPDSGEQLSEFSMEGNILRIKLTAEYPVAREDVNQRLTLYSACYPRLASFQ